MDNHDTRKRQSEMMSVSSASLTSLILQQLDVLQSHQRHKTRNINTLTEQLSLLKKPTCETQTNSVSAIRLPTMFATVVSD